MFVSESRQEVKLSGFFKKQNKPKYFDSASWNIFQSITLAINRCTHYIVLNTCQIQLKMKHFDIIQAKWISLFDSLGKLSETQSILLNPHFSQENSPVKKMNGFARVIFD